MSDQSIFNEAVDGYGFEAVEQTTDGLFCEGCLTVHKRPTKMYKTSCAPGQLWCRSAIVTFWNPEQS